MTKKERRCDGKNCDHEFDDGEEYIYLADDPEEIYCSRGCAESWNADPYRYGTIGDDEDDEDYDHDALDLHTLM